MSLLWHSGLAGGALACCTLAVLKQPITLLLQLQPDVLHEATPYWWIRVGITPLVLLNMTLSGILQGFNRVTAVSLLISGQALLEIAGSVLVFKAGLALRGSYLRSMGLVTLLSAFIAACVGLVLVKLLPPVMTQAIAEAVAPLLTEDHDSPLAPCSPLGPFASDVALHTDEEPLVVEGSVQGSPEGGSTARAELLGFLSDGASMLVRSSLLQATFFIALAVASRLGTAALAAHQIVAQLWLLTSYVTDGFAVAGTVLGSRLSSQRHITVDKSATRSLQILCRRVLLSGLAIGVTFGIAFFAAQDWLISLFTQSKETTGILQYVVWPLVCIVQPLNSLVFVYDGLLYASQSFAYTRNVMLLGFILVFCPMIIVAELSIQALWGVWVAKAALNLCRLLGGVFRVHFWWLKAVNSISVSV
ncbi:hypothetical protein ABBQ32_013706 [Trebouxia sp. C0010 RCD-2024]